VGSSAGGPDDSRRSVIASSFAMLRIKHVCHALDFTKTAAGWQAPAELAENRGIEKIKHFGFVLLIIHLYVVYYDYCNQSAVGVSHRTLEWQTFAGIALAVHSGPSPVIV
jgi:hypothetical protein